MTSLPPNADELVSAYLDGEAAADEITLIESNDELMARVERMRSLTSQFNASPTPPVDQREQHISAALDQFDEMMATASTEATPLSVVVTQDLESDHTEANAAGATPAASTSPRPSSMGVTSLDAARERRTSRRSIGLIAAAAAMILLFVGLNAVGFGSSSSNELAGDAAEVEADTSSTMAEASSAADAAGDAMDDQETGGLSEAPSAPQSARADGDSDDAMEDESAEAAMDAATGDAMEDAVEEEPMYEEEAMDDESAAEVEADGDEAAPQPTSPPAPETAFNLGDFETQDLLKSDLSEFPEEDLRNRAFDIGEGLFPRCQKDIPELSGIDTATLVGEATVDGEPVEIHLQPTEAGGPRLYVVRPGTCEVLTTVSP